MFGVWKSSGTKSIGTYYIGSCGTQVAALGMGGVSAWGACEEYNGATWESISALSGYYDAGAGAGTVTAGMFFGGQAGAVRSSATFEWDGVSWSSGGTLSAARQDLGGAGTLTAGLAIGGNESTSVNTTQEYDGTTWTSGGNLSAVKTFPAGVGTQTAGMSVAGAVSKVVELYNGTSWSTTGSLAIAKNSAYAFGTQSSAIAAGGSPGGSQLYNSEEFNGSVWFAAQKLLIAKTDGGSTGTVEAGLIFAGYASGLGSLTTTEEYESEPLIVGIQPYGIVQAKTGTSLISPASYTPLVDDLVVAVIAADTDVVGTLAMTGGTGVATLGSTTQAETATFASNVVLAVNIATVTAVGSGSSTVTLSGLTSEAHSASFYVLRDLETSPVDKKANATGTSTAPSSGETATLTEPRQIVLGAVGIEGPDGDTSGSWNTGSGNVYDYAQRLGTTGSGATSNITLNTAVNLVSVTDARTASMTGITSRDWAALVVTFKKKKRPSLPPGLINKRRHIRNVFLSR